MAKRFQPPGVGIVPSAIRAPPPGPPPGALRRSRRSPRVSIAKLGAGRMTSVNQPREGLGLIERGVLGGAGSRHHERMGPAERADPWFEELYARAADEPERIPWARLAPQPELVGWLDRHRPPRGAPALVVACGLGDDAEELSRRGCAVEAFDLSPSAIASARRRFPRSAVRYRVADLFALPADWAGRFTIVVEVLTVQSLPPEAHEEAIAAITRCVAPGGHLLVRTAVRADDEPATARPWPLRHAELAWFTADGLVEVARCASADGMFVHLHLRRPE